jgi:hypothetical protein
MDMDRFRETRFVRFARDEVNGLEIESSLVGVPEVLRVVRTGDRGWRLSLSSGESLVLEISAEAPGPPGRRPQDTMA